MSAGINPTAPRRLVLGKKVSFHNVVATLDPKAPRRLVLACHYDSLNKPSKESI